MEDTSTTHSLWDPPLVGCSGLVCVLALVQIGLPEQPGGPGMYRAVGLHVHSVPGASSTDSGCWELGPPFLVDGGK